MGQCGIPVGLTTLLELSEQSTASQAGIGLHPLDFLHAMQLTLADRRRMHHLVGPRSQLSSCSSLEICFAQQAIKGLSKWTIWLRYRPRPCSFSTRPWGRSIRFDRSASFWACYPSTWCPASSRRQWHCHGRYHIGQGRCHSPENSCQLFERARERRQGFRRGGKELASGVGHLQQQSDRVRGECGSVEISNGAELNQVIGGFGQTLFSRFCTYFQNT
jgi:hypothetical protein